MASPSPRTAVLLAVVALPLCAAAASYALADDPVPQVPTEVRIGEVTGPRTTSTPPSSAIGTTRPRVVSPAPPVDGGDDDGDDESDDSDESEDGDESDYADDDRDDGD
ncbi:hypothetical protein [Actinokineospora fastidiosa]|nr:hypothetical protein [Actinokineospora fastidiosa]